MDYKIQEIEGIGPSNGKKLEQAGILKSSDLLNQCGSSKGRKDTSATTGISESVLLKWANMADLMRISGIGKQYAELLEAAGVDTVKELKQRKAENLAEKMNEVNSVKKLTRGVPASNQVSEWIKQASNMKPAISH
jgi:predicted flap endonuclease-1-like 5' DNA nuclease